MAPSLLTRAATLALRRAGSAKLTRCPHHETDTESVSQEMNDTAAARTKRYRRKRVIYRAVMPAHAG